jgi:aerobic-type carbon monoxide dehydrogenase small subunit (CoxS/CutS family)
VKQAFRLRINGQDYEVFVPVHTTLLEVLRDELGLVGTKEGCDEGACGACTVLVDGVPWLSCLTLIGEVQEKNVETVEGLAQGQNLHQLQKSFLEYGAVQCGFCTPGMLMAAKALLADYPDPSEEDVRAALEGNLCRCTGYVKIVDAILAASERIRGGVNENE